MAASQSPVQDQTKRRSHLGPRIHLVLLTLPTWCGYNVPSCLPQLDHCLSTYLPHHNAPSLQNVSQIDSLFFNLLFCGVLSHNNSNKDEQYRNQTVNASVGWRERLRRGHKCSYLIKYPMVGNGVTIIDDCKLTKVYI